jgi:hypothetical protein
MPVLFRQLLIACSLVSISSGLATAADPPPMPPCAGAIQPDLPPAGAPPRISVWFAAELPNWQPADCLGWPRGSFSVAVATSGRFRAADGIERVLERMAAVSQFRAIRYWSISRGRWRPLVDGSSALSGPDRALARPDFALTELADGRDFYLWLGENSPAGSVVYRARLRSSSTRYEIDLVNVTALRTALVPVVAPGNHRIHYAFEEVADDEWAFFSLLRSGPALVPLPAERRGSYINRAAAIFRYAAGIATDLEPPLAPIDPP